LLCGIFFSLERKTDKLWLFTLGNFVDIFLEQNEPVTSRKIADSFSALKQKLEFCKTCIWCYVFDECLTWKGFSGEIGVIRCQWHLA
jgi:hypothetical protein